MVKVDIIRSIQLKAGLPFGDAEKLVNDMLELMKTSLESGEDVLISGFGRFELKDKPARPGRNPKSKEAYEISARRVATFYPSNIWRQKFKSKSHG